MAGDEQRKTEAYAPELMHGQALAFIEAQQGTSFFKYYPSIIGVGKQAVRNEDCEGVWLKARVDPQVPIELYDLAEGFGEQNNLAGAHPEMVGIVVDPMAQEHEAVTHFLFQYEKQ